MKTPEHPIFLESVEYIRSQIGLTGLNSVQQSVLERIIHSSGDLAMQSYIRFSPNACEDGITALNKGAHILTDTYMAKAAVTPVAQRTLNLNVKCILEMAPEFIDSSSKTRSAIGMHHMWLDMEQKKELLLGPVVFIGVSECKNRLLNSDCPHILIEGSKGGASMAAATVNALLRAADY